MVLMVFSAVSMVSSFEADDNTHGLVGVGERSKSKQTTVGIVTPY